MFRKSEVIATTQKKLVEMAKKAGIPTTYPKEVQICDENKEPMEDKDGNPITKIVQAPIGRGELYHNLITNAKIENDVITVTELEKAEGSLKNLQVLAERIGVKTSSKGTSSNPDLEAAKDDYKALCALAKPLNINPVGKSKVVLFEEISSKGETSEPSNVDAAKLYSDIFAKARKEGKLIVEIKTVREPMDEAEFGWRYKYNTVKDGEVINGGDDFVVHDNESKSLRKEYKRNGISVAPHYYDRSQKHSKAKRA